MASPRVFISSTYYDLRNLRSALEAFISSLGYEPVLSEKGDIAYSPDAPLDESCYRAASQADIFVLIIGGRYGSPASDERSQTHNDFFDRYDSITKQEYAAALREHVPSYILIDRGVHAEYQTFRRNRDRTDIHYAHVDSINVFHLIDEILNQPRNNPVFHFERYQEIEEWLRGQWAGLFTELLSRLSGQAQLQSLSSQVSLLSESNKTLRRYLETVVSQVSPDSSQSLIREESDRLDDAAVLSLFGANRFVNWLIGKREDVSHVRELFRDASSMANLLELARPHIKEYRFGAFKGWLDDDEQPTQVLNDANEAREIIGLPPFDWK